MLLRSAGAFNSPPGTRCTLGPCCRPRWMLPRRQRLHQRQRQPLRLRMAPGAALGATATAAPAGPPPAAAGRMTAAQWPACGQAYTRMGAWARRGMCMCMWLVPGGLARAPTERHRSRHTPQDGARSDQRVHHAYGAASCTRMDGWMPGRFGCCYAPPPLPAPQATAAVVGGSLGLQRAACHMQHYHWAGESGIGLDLREPPFSLTQRPQTTPPPSPQSAPRACRRRRLAPRRPTRPAGRPGCGPGSEDRVLPLPRAPPAEPPAQA